ncbi:hypothetical protein GGR53DRAFT_209794 [Hypoxylon sp. FL1150]|nr:hypothetical protein GGR53DRAFT_209794 [Hypoxylon sp. FL1150]
MVRATYCIAESSRDLTMLGLVRICKNRKSGPSFDGTTHRWEAPNAQSASPAHARLGEFHFLDEHQLDGWTDRLRDQHTCTYKYPINAERLGPEGTHRYVLECADRVPQIHKGRAKSVPAQSRLCRSRHLDSVDQRYGDHSSEKSQLQSEAIYRQLQSNSLKLTSVPSSLCSVSIQFSHRAALRASIAAWGSDVKPFLIMNYNKSFTSNRAY